MVGVWRDSVWWQVWYGDRLATWHIWPGGRFGMAAGLEWLQIRYGGRSGIGACSVWAGLVSWHVQTKINNIE